MTKLKELWNKIHFLPAKGSSRWINVLAIVFIANIAALFISRALIGQTTTTANMAAFVGLSLGIAIVSCLGYFGFEVFSLLVLAGNLMGIIYLFFIILTNASQGWNDLTSLIGLFYFVAMGVVFGIMMQVIVLLSTVKLRGRK